MAEQKKKETEVAPNRVTVTLLKDHTHAGRECKPGEKISVTAAQAKWLASLGVIKAEKEG